jgi:hypothetical protein
MRTPVMALAVLLGFFVLASGPAEAAMVEQSGTLVVAQAQPPQIDVQITEQRGGAWYASPVWIAIGVLGLVVLILLIVMAARGGGTTVVRD